jgi:cation:H+ antiporter
MGSLPLAYSISGQTLSPLDFDDRQSIEVFLTAAQSLFAVAILVSLSVNRWEALALAGLFLTQFFVTSESVHIAYGFLYLILAFVVFVRDIPRMPTFARAVRQTVTDPGGADDEFAYANNKHPP